jgi:hypothetical protein
MSVQGKTASYLNRSFTTLSSAFRKRQSCANQGRIFLAIMVGICLNGIHSPLQAQTEAPSTYSAYTGTDVKSIPPAPALGPANSVIKDPTFGSSILRVTDQNTNGGESLMPTDAGFHRTFNADSTAIKLGGPRGESYWMEFNSSTFRVGDGSSKPSLHPLTFGVTWEWSTVDPNIIYYLRGSQIAKYNKATGATADLGGPSTGEPVAYMAVVIGADNWVCAAVGSGNQDSYTKIFCVNPVSPGTSKFIDVYNKTINGVPQGDPNWPTSAAGQVIGVHGLSGGTGPSYLEVTFHQQSWGANGDSVFNLATNTWSLVTNADPFWSGHVSMGNGKFANSGGSANGLDGRGMVLRDPNNLMNSSGYQFVYQAPASQRAWCDGEHISWLNSMKNPNAPILVSRYDIINPCQFIWSAEIDAAAVDGSNTVWRFAHNHNLAKGCYANEAFAEISNDGRWALFSSSWDGTLGPDTAFGCSTRIDTFIVDLMSAGSSTSGTSSGSTSGTSGGSTSGASGGSTSGASGGSTSGASGGSTSGTSGGSTSGTTGGSTSGVTATGSGYRVEQSNPAVTWSGQWSVNKGSFNSGGSAKLANSAGARATFAFIGTSVNWIAYQGQSSGIARVYVDGALTGTVDTYAPASKAQAVAYTVSGLASGAHSIVVEATGTKNNASGSSWIWVDAFDYVGAAPGSALTTVNPPANASGSFGGATLTSSGGTQLAVGSAEVSAGSGGPAPAGLALVSYRPNGVKISETGIPASVPVLSGRLSAEVSTVVDTGLALSNPNSSQATVSFFLTDSNGTNSGGGSFTIPAHGQIARFLDQAPFNAPRMTDATLTFTSDVPVSAIALRGRTNERSEFLISTAPIANLSESTPATVFFPDFADGGGWTTQFILVNPTDQTITGTLNFFEQGTDGTTANPAAVKLGGQTPVAPSYAYSIPPRSSRRFTTLGANSAAYVGTAQATPDQSNLAPVGVAVFSYRNGGVTVSEAGVPAVDVGAAFRLYVESSSNGLLRSGIAVLNSSEAGTNVTFDLLGLDGTSTGLRGSLAVPASGQRALFLDEIPGFESLPRPFKGFVRISSPAAADLAVVGLRGQWNERGDFLVTTTPPSNETAASAAEIAFPQVVDGGGFTTQVILYSGTPAEPAAGNLNLFSQAGGQLSFTMK